MKILLASSELHPYSKTGGLADMVGALAKSLARAGHQVGVVTPLYRGIRERFAALQKFDWQMALPLGARQVQGEIWTLEPSEHLTLYFVSQPDFYDRANLYQDNGADHPDNDERFIFLSKAVVHLARYLPWHPEIVHVHDWQTALVPVLVRAQKEREGWGNAPPCCLTIHNLAYQGIFPRARYDLTNLPPDYFNPDGAEFYGQLNCLKAGICFANILTTVSPRYAREITTEAFGCGLDGVLRRRQDALVGILNGVDYEEWNPTQDPFLKHPYSLRNQKGKTAGKLELQKDFGLRPDPDVSLFGNISRLVDQKGVDIQLGALEEMLSSDMQFVLLGSGSSEYEKAYQRLAQRYPRQVGVKISYDHALAHRIEAACDFYLMPSLFEPSGLNQMYSLRYGTIPIVRATGGLDDSVIDLSEDTEGANGIKFYEYSVRALSKAIRKALVLYGNAPLFRRYRRNAMRGDFSWDKTSLEYQKIYRRALSAGGR